jgi:membrane-associated phospholipid phosphatase
MASKDGIVETAAAGSGEAQAPPAASAMNWRDAIRWPLLGVSAVLWLAVAVLTLVVAANPFLPLDATLEKDIQATNLGPLPLIFPFFSWIGDAKGAILEAAGFVLLLLVNRPAWRLALAGALAGGWYILLSHLIFRARPDPSQVLRVTEHPGASSFPSGHTVFFTTVCTLAVLCFVWKPLPRWGRVAALVMAAAVAVLGGVSRVWVGAHWPTDVFTGFLIAVAWLTLVVSVRWISEPAFRQ